MFVVIDLKGDLVLLFDRKFICDIFLKNYVENVYKFDIIKLYLLSLRYFCSFVLIECFDVVRVNEVSVYLIDEKVWLWLLFYKKVS